MKLCVTVVLSLLIAGCAGHAQVNQRETAVAPQVNYATFKMFPIDRPPEYSNTIE